MRIVITAEREIEISFLMDEAHEYVVLLTTGYSNFFSWAEVVTEQKDGYLSVILKSSYFTFMEKLEETIPMRYAYLISVIKKALPNCMTEDDFESFKVQQDSGPIYIYGDTHETHHSDKVRAASDNILTFTAEAMNQLLTEAANIDETGGKITDFHLCLLSGGSPFAVISLLCRFGVWKWSVADVDFIGRRGSGIYYQSNEQAETLLLVKKKIFHFHRQTRASGEFKNKPYPNMAVRRRITEHSVAPLLIAEKVTNKEILR